MSDLINRQDAIDAIQKAYDKETLLHRFVRGIATKTLNNLPSAQQWIPCSERLPEKNGRYLVTNSAWGAMEVDWNAWMDGEWLYPNTKPIAWMPLPEPWKGEADD